MVPVKSSLIISTGMGPYEMCHYLIKIYVRYLKDNVNGDTNLDDLQDEVSCVYTMTVRATY